MMYFIDAQQRKASRSTLYFEFQIGRFQHKHWLSDSIYLHADTFDQLGMYHLFSTYLPDFNYYGPTLVSPPQYEVLKAGAMSCGNEEIAAVLSELDNWVTNCFQKAPCFSILGI